LAAMLPSKYADKDVTELFPEFRPNKAGRFRRQRNFIALTFLLVKRGQFLQVSKYFRRWTTDMEERVFLIYWCHRVTLA
jgi:hypothetical protein